MKPLLASEGAILPASVFEIMDAIWEAQEASAEGRSVLTRDILDHGGANIQSISFATIVTLINRLIMKGFLKTEKPIGRANVYVPLMTRDEYKERAYKYFLEKTMMGDRVKLAALVLGELNAEEVEAVKQMVGEKK